MSVVYIHMTRHKDVNTKIMVTPLELHFPFSQLYKTSYRNSRFRPLTDRGDEKAC